MGTFSVWHWLIVAAVVLVLFGGRGKIPALMKDMGKGITAFKRGLKEEDKEDGDGAEELIEDKATEAAKASEKTKA